MSATRRTSATALSTAAASRAARSACPGALCAFDRGVEVMELDGVRLVRGEPVDPDDHALARLHLALPAEGGLLDLLLHPSGLDRRDGPAELVDAPDQLAGPHLELVGERLHVPGAAERVGGVRRAGLVHEDLLRAQRQRRRPLGGQRQRLVEAVRGPTGRRRRSPTAPARRRARGCSRAAGR